MVFVTGTTLAFTDADGNIITSVDGDGRQHEGGVKIVTSVPTSESEVTIVTHPSC